VNLIVSEAIKENVFMGIIYFFGPDRTGKSTLVNALTKELCNRECNVKRSWMRGSHTFVFLVASFLSKFDCFKGLENPYYNINIPKNLKRFWQFLEFLSALPIILGKFLVPSLLKYCILADRYTIDLAVWLCLTTHDYSFLKTFESKILIALAQKTSAKFYVTANFEELGLRSKEELWFPKEQLYLYGKLAGAVDAYIIDTTKKPVEKCLQEVLKVIATTNSVKSGTI
jgi:GTPase SAR1 family protein